MDRALIESPFHPILDILHVLDSGVVGRYQFSDDPHEVVEVGLRSPDDSA